MNMITVWGRATSSNVQVVMWAIAELGLAHERLDWGGKFGGNDDPAYRAMNPNGLVPTIRDGDLVMFESPAILRYLGARYGDENFWPSDPARRGPLDMWAEWVKTTLAPPLVYSVFWQLIRTTAADRNHAAIADGVAKLKSLSRMIGQRLGDGPYLNGEHLCFADIMLGHLLYRYYTLDFERAETPNLDAYYARLQQRPAYRAHAMVSYEPLRVPGA
ncbi:MAG TPA: glutathione S-transferase family protein [Thermohalobaculum sp.]|nr:glutathione S-transferase family protein [Thermohalobaculum sp.]